MSTALRILYEEDRILEVHARRHTFGGTFLYGRQDTTADNLTSRHDRPGC